MTTNKTILILLSVTLATFSLNPTSIHSAPQMQTACTESCIVNDKIIDSSFTESSHEVIHYQSGVQVERISHDEWIIRDYPNTFNSEKPEKESRSWITIGLAILKYANRVLQTCQTIQYVTGHDICRIVLSYLSTPHGNGTYTYELTGNYIPGYIPGCEPSHSLPCNSGYWEYRVRVQ